MKAAANIMGRAFLVFAFFMALCGLGYTLVMTGAAQLLFPSAANGSVIEVDGKTYGSSLLGQSFTGDEYLWGRIMNLDTGSFTDEAGNPVLYARPSNLTPAGAELEALVAQRVERLQAANPAMEGVPIPVDLVTCSGSGLDPEISPDAADYQIQRVAGARGMSTEEVQAVIDSCTTGRFLGVLGEPRVNVLKVNLMLDGILEA